MSRETIEDKVFTEVMHHYPDKEGAKIVDETIKITKELEKVPEDVMGAVLLAVRDIINGCENEAWDVLFAESIQGNCFRCGEPL